MTTSSFSLAGKVALVTGGNAGIGRALALALKEAGARVIVGARRTERNQAVLAELGDDALTVPLDVTDEDSVQRAVDAAKAEFGGLDILVNNAGVAHRASALELSRVDWDRVIATNLTGPFLCTKHAARAMTERGGGKIINIASAYGLVAPSKGLLVAYTASKHGLIGLTRVNAVELAPLNIQVNAIAPGYFFTEINAELRGTPFEQAVNRRTPTGRWGEPSELAGTCIYLASAASNHVTGACVPVDGGYVASDGLDRG
jgi:NAD(P)-dependent dehydrogenase (short-subunit alcohol dehydrogenase family)